MTLLPPQVETPAFSITIGAQEKAPGKGGGIRPVEVTATETTADDEIDAYARLLSDAMEGDHLLFVRSDMVDVQWEVGEHILDNVTPVHPYAPGTWGPSEGSVSCGIWAAGKIRDEISLDPSNTVVGQLGVTLL
jgi:glucose-6-phosphate 1-dehydrogenase